MTPVSHSGTDESDWFELPGPGEYRIDVDVPATVTAISFTMETMGVGATRPKPVKKPNDVDTDWTITDESACLKMDGPAKFRINVASRTGTGDVVITGAQVEGEC